MCTEDVVGTSAYIECVLECVLPCSQERRTGQGRINAPDGCRLCDFQPIVVCVFFFLDWLAV